MQLPMVILKLIDSGYREDNFTQRALSHSYNLHFRKVPNKKINWNFVNKKNEFSIFFRS